MDRGLHKRLLRRASSLIGWPSPVPRLASSRVCKAQNFWIAGCRWQAAQRPILSGLSKPLFRSQRRLTVCSPLPPRIRKNKKAQLRAGQGATSPQWRAPTPLGRASSARYRLVDRAASRTRADPSSSSSPRPRQQHGSRPSPGPSRRRSRSRSARRTAARTATTTASAGCRRSSARGRARCSRCTARRSPSPCRPTGSPGCRRTRTTASGPSSRTPRTSRSAPPPRTTRTAGRGGSRSCGARAGRTCTGSGGSASARGTGSPRATGRGPRGGTGMARLRPGPGRCRYVSFLCVVCVCHCAMLWWLWSGVTAMLGFDSLLLLWHRGVSSFISLFFSTVLY